MIKKRLLLALITLSLFSCGEKKEDSHSQRTTKETTIPQKTNNSAKTETAKTETAKTETAKTETAKTETAKTETAKTETAKTETAEPNSTYKKSGKNVVAVSGQHELNEYIGNSQLTVVDMYANWCGPCKLLAPVLRDLALEYGETVSFVKVDVDKNRRLAQKYRANSIPLVLFFKNGSVIDRMEGFGGRNPLEQKIKSNM